ncbi:hypothetical protein C8Q80DRAFT_1148148 [Daedaleopsis nitida]|nr:hypothetical protein C8Q80DRAFT_1148148 [Daedaleopsis nitida]
MNANLEEAANIATEYLASIENLPNEAQHLLIEIKHRDTKSHDLIEEIRKETQKYFRHSSKNAGQPLPSKDAAIPDTVSVLYAEVDALAAEKTALADRLVKIFERAMARLQHDLTRIHKLQGDEPGLPPTQQFLSSVESTVQQLQASFKTAATAAAESPPATTPQVQTSGRDKKRPRLAGAGSIKLPSPIPVSGSTHASASASSLPKSNLSHQKVNRISMSPVRSRRAHASTGMDDEDAEGDDDAEDQEPYCYCQKLSYGEMIACDNESCRFQWFHISCISLPPNQTLPDTWYCDECSALLGIANKTTQTTGTSGGRKGRKK